MTKEFISTETAPRAVGAYSQAVRAQEFLFISGPIGLDPATVELDSSDMAEQAMRNLHEILTAADSS